MWQGRIAGNLSNAEEKQAECMLVNKEFVRPLLLLKQMGFVMAQTGEELVFILQAHSVEEISREPSGRRKKIVGSVTFMIMN